MACHVTLWDRQGSQYVGRLKSLGNEGLPDTKGTSVHPNCSKGCWRHQTCVSSDPIVVGFQDPGLTHGQSRAHGDVTAVSLSSTAPWALPRGQWDLHHCHLLLKSIEVQAWISNFYIPLVGLTPAHTIPQRLRLAQQSLGENGVLLLNIRVRTVRLRTEADVNLFQIVHWFHETAFGSTHNVDVEFPHAPLLMSQLHLLST